MRPPRLLLLLFCFVTLPIFLTCISLLSAEQARGVDVDSSLNTRASRFRALFSFNTPASLFPPSAIISFTDDNSTFFLARPAAFGPLLEEAGLSGQLWVGSGFGTDSLPNDDVHPGSTGELGCSDVPGWENDSQSKVEKASKEAEKNAKVKSAAISKDAATSQDHRRHVGDSGKTFDVETAPSADDGTDDHLHHPLPPSDTASSTSSELTGDKNNIPTHADIQSLQESAEIAGKVVLLSRGGCGFLEKVKWAQRRGGIAVIVGDDTKGGSLVTMYARGDTSNITIPAVFTSYTTAHLLSSLVPTGEKTGQDGKNLNVGKDGFVRDTAKGSPPSKPTTVPARRPSSSMQRSSDTNSHSSPGFFRSLLSLIGIGSSNGYPWHVAEDSRRPPSSGNIDWVIVDDWRDEETPGKSKTADGKNTKTPTSKQKDGSTLTAGNIAGVSDEDGFEIGVQDWRDPDLVPPPKSSPSAKPGDTHDKPHDTSQRGKDDKSKAGKDSQTNPSLKGGSITPGSGEYTSLDKAADANHDSKKTPEKSSGRTGSSDDGNGWFSNHFGWTKDSEIDIDTPFPTSHKGVQHGTTAKTISGQGAKSESNSMDKHEGIWVTLTPTSISTSPFFDTLLVLVVSPLITLTVVYALLLLRSRIRRRRWRAPKSVVERLPVRTYQTMPSITSSTSETPRPPGSGVATPTSPLLESRSQAVPGRNRPRSQTVSGIVISAEPSIKGTPLSNIEKQNAGSSLWRQKYTGRQVECVVCLEEYVDGQSRVMSLPCGHEFHAECM